MFFFVFFVLLFVYLEMSLFPNIFSVSLPFYLCKESASYVSFLPDGVFLSYLVTTGWIFDIVSLLCENSIDQSINQ